MEDQILSTPPDLTVRLADGRFPPGISGNPGGRPRRPPEELRASADEAVARLEKMMRGMDAAMAFRASVWLAERYYGKAATNSTIELCGTTDAAPTTINVVFVGPDDATE